MAAERLSLEQLFDRGWTINHQRVWNYPAASVSMCLTRDGYRSVCVPGYGETKEGALADAVEEVNAWIERQSADHSTYRGSMVGGAIP